jgi:hypothetical protein
MKHIHIFIAALLLAPLAVLAANGLKTGEIGFPYLLRALANSGRSDVIFAMINQTDKQNRLIGDKLPADANARTVEPPPGFLGGNPFKAGRYTYTTYDPFNANSPLLPSGLLGPVQIKSTLTEAVK